MMMNNNFMTAKKLLVYVLIFSHFLAGCVTTGNQNNTVNAGPKSSSYYDEKKAEPVSIATKLDVIIPVFDPGLSGNSKDYKEDGIWPELRRSEANRFAYKLKQALDDSNEFGAVRVTPDETASGDLYVLGKIEALKKRSASELDNLQYIADLRFGASFNDTAFMEYMDTNRNPIKLVSKPSDNDPLFQKVKAIRIREQLFVDNLQQNYSSFSQSMDASYLKWQEASFTEKQLREKAESDSWMKTIGGIVLIGLAIAAAASSDGDSFGDAAADVGAIAGGLGGALLISSGFESREEAKFHQDAINEIGESINLELAPQVISMEDETVELTGNIQEQFTQWRAFLKRIYEQESTPEVAL
jgi:hypothetical protein